MRGQLDQAGRKEQNILALADGAFDVLELWRGLPEGVTLLTRTARNRCLYWLPQPHSGPGRPASYGQKAPTRPSGYTPVCATGPNDKCWFEANKSRCVINA
ncbi:MAG: hypothetical protein HS126_11235 [Anaerolineales bacterium]|nr:hypothetical protein [Anaerolineales bacterium]